MESNFDNGSFIIELDPQRHVVRKNKWIAILGTMVVVSSFIAVYCYYRMIEFEVRQK